MAAVQKPLMIKLGCVSTHPEDLEFFSSVEVAELLRQRNLELTFLPEVVRGVSVDAWLISTNLLNTLLSAPAPGSRVFVLLSSSQEEALSAWQQGASFFLLRPFDLPAVQQAFQRIEQCLYWERRILPPGHQEHTLELQMTKGRRVLVPAKEILFLEARGEMTLVHLSLPNQEKITTTRNLGFWEQQLPSPSFVRVHKKYLVNLTHVSSLFSETILVGEIALPVAKRRRKEVENFVYSGQLLRSMAGKSGEREPT